MIYRSLSIIILPLIAMSLLSGCETLSKPRYKEPEGSGLATIHSNKKGNIYSQWAWENYTLHSIDGTLVDYTIPDAKDTGNLVPLKDVKSKSSMQISEGEHDLIIDVVFKRDKKSGLFVAKIPLKLIVEKNRQYHLNGEVTGKIVKIWLEYSNGEHASKIGSSEYTLTGRGQVVPILIPGQSIPIFIFM